MPTAQLSVSLSIGGVSINQSLNRTFDHPNPYEVPLPVGTAGTLSTRTDDDTGVVTVASHALIVGDKVDIYWSGGVRYGMTVSAQTATTITVGTGAGEVGAGDVFPAAATAVVITKQVVINTPIDGDRLSIIGIVLEVAAGAVGKGHVDMLDVGPATIEEIDLVGNEPKIWDIDGGATNVFTGNPITTTRASNGSATVAATLKILAGEDSTP